MTEIALATDFAVIIVAATAVGLAARQLGQPTIVAYIATGLILGPALFGVVEPSELTETMAELGLAFLLFLLGIKMRIDEIRHILAPIVKISIPQMAGVTVVGVGVSFALGFSVTESIIIGLAVMYSSTAVVVKMLTDKGEATSLPGKIDVGVLLVQDIVVVIILAVLAAGVPESATEVAVNLGTVLALVAAIGAAAVLSSKYVLPDVFRRIADNKEVFFIASLGWAFLFVLVSMELDLSIEMGAFLAGIAIAQLPYSKELQDRVAPLTDLFMLIFFASVGLQLDASDLFEHWEAAVVASAVLMPAKFWIFFYLIDWQNFDLETTFVGSANMVQVSEFGLLVGTAAVVGGFVEEDVLGFLTLIALVTMSLSVYVLQYNHELHDRLHPYFSRWETDEDSRGKEDEHRNHAVVIGYDGITRGTLPLLNEKFGDVVVIDRKVEHVEALKDTEYDVIYGDIRNSKIRKSAGLKYADFVLSSSVQVDVNKAVIEAADDEATVFVEAEWTEDARELYEEGADFVVMSTHLSAERLADYLRAYFEDSERFEEGRRDDTELLKEAAAALDTSAMTGDEEGETDE